jgi:hypothetical protein
MQPQVPGVPNPLALFPAASLETVLAIIITLVFIWWAIFTLVVIYHWMKYSRDSVFAVPAIAVHIFISGWIFVFATGGLH